MKTTCLLLVLLLAGRPLSAQTVPSSCLPFAQLENSYRNDVADLALQRLYETGSPDTALIEIPQRHQDTIMQALAAVVNTGASLEADSVFRNYCVHRWPHKAYKGVLFDLKVDTNYAWAKQWYLGNTLTGNAAIDSFMARHGVYMESYSCISNYEYLNNIATLRATRAINLPAFVDSMLLFAGAKYFYPKGFAGDGARMEYRRDTAAHFTFVAAWGDCLAGCTAWKEWQYRVTLSNCTVTLDSTSRSSYPPIPPYLPNCNLNSIGVAPRPPVNTSSLVLFPNPASGLLQVSGLATPPARYRICDPTGRALLQGACLSNTLEVATLPAGLYLLTVWEKSGQQHTRRFIKE